MLLPPYGLCLPCRYLRALDGRTIQVRVGPRGIVCTIEIADCDCPDLSHAGGAAARDAADSILTEAERLSICLPLPEDPIPLVEAIRPDHHIAGNVFLDGDTTLTQYLIRRGLADRRRLGRA